MIDMNKKAKDILEDYSNCYSQVDLETLAKFLDQIKAEAIKEFAERLKVGVPQETGVIRCADIDNLLAEMESERE